MQSLTKEQYTIPEHATHRYPSNSKFAIGGYAYIASYDHEYLQRLSVMHQLEAIGTWHNPEISEPEEIVLL